MVDDDWFAFQVRIVVVLDEEPWAAVRGRQLPRLQRRGVRADATGFVDQFDGLRPSFAECHERRGAMVWSDLRASATHDLRGVGVRSDDRDTAQRGEVEGQQRSIVLDQHHRGRAHRTGEPSLRILVTRPLAGRCSIVPGTEPCEHTQDPRHDRVELRLGDVAGPHGVRQRGTEAARRTRHLEIQPGVRRGVGVQQAPPVRHDHPGEAPLAAQHAGQQCTVVRTMVAVEPVVRGHHGQGAGRDASFERQQVDLAERPLVDDRVDRVALPLGLVPRQVLDRGGDTLALDAGDVGRAERARQVGVLGEALERPAGERRPLEVHGRPEQHPCRPRPCLASQFGAHFLDEADVPGRSERRAGREGERRRGSRSPEPSAGAVGAVGHAP